MYYKYKVWHVWLISKNLILFYPILNIIFEDTIELNNNKKNMEQVRLYHEPIHMMTIYDILLFRYLCDIFFNLTLL